MVNLEKRLNELLLSVDALDFIYSCQDDVIIVDTFDLYAETHINLLPLELWRWAKNHEAILNDHINYHELYYRCGVIDMIVTTQKDIIVDHLEREEEQIMEAFVILGFIDLYDVRNVDVYYYDEVVKYAKVGNSYNQIKDIILSFNLCEADFT